MLKRPPSKRNRPLAPAPIHQAPPASSATELKVLGPDSAPVVQYCSTRGESRLRPPVEVPTQTQPSRSPVTAPVTAEGNSPATARTKRSPLERYKPRSAVQIQSVPSLPEAKPVTLVAGKP